MIFGVFLDLCLPLLIFPSLLFLDLLQLQLILSGNLHIRVTSLQAHLNIQDTDLLALKLSWNRKSLRRHGLSGAFARALASLASTLLSIDSLLLCS
jgi:hypothetical protein